MLPREPWPMRDRCGCGAAITWEMRRTWRTRRFLGICRNADCGRITTQVGTEGERAEGLEHFLLEDRPLQPDTPPQVRFFLRYASIGWRHHHASCSCGSTLNFSMRIPMRQGREGDPYATIICLCCGQLTAEHSWMGEFVEVVALPEAWSDFSPVIAGVKQALDARLVPVGAENGPLDFGEFGTFG